MKKLSINLLLIVHLLLCSIVLRGQSSIESFQQMIEELYPFQNEELDYESLFENLYQLYQDPVLLNEADRNDLQALQFLTTEQVNEIIDHKMKFGEFLSVYELQAIPSLDLIDLKRLLPFIKIKKDGAAHTNLSLWKQIKQAKSSQLILRFRSNLEKKAGYSGDSKSYLGSPSQLYLRYRIRHKKNFSFGLTLEKDQGEPFIWRPPQQYGLNFISYHMQLNKVGPLTNLILGDYQIQYGQSLIYGAGFNLGKGGNAVSLARRSNVGALPYTSVVEEGFFRGFSFETHFDRKNKINTHFSHKTIDLSIRLKDSITFINQINSGLHRTKSELENKNRGRKTDVGLTFLHTNKNKSFNFGINILYSHFSQPIRELPNTYNQFDFLGRGNYVAGTFANTYWRNLHLFGEIAKSRSGGLAHILGGIISLSSKFHLAYLNRDYSRHFHSFHSTALSENTTSVNEKGHYLGITYKELKKINVDAYIDVFHFPWLKFRVDKPSRGYEYFSRIVYRLPTKASISVAWKQESKARNHPKESPNFNAVSNYIQNKYILNLNYQLQRGFKMQTRIQSSSFKFNQQKTTGFAIMQDFDYKVKDFTFSGRFALFDAQDFENRQYAFEKDVLYSFSVPAYNGTGARSFLMLKHKISKKMQYWLRWSRTFLPFSYSIGSGNEQIDQNRRSEIKIQAIFTI